MPIDINVIKKQIFHLLFGCAFLFLPVGCLEKRGVLSGQDLTGKNPIDVEGVGSKPTPVPGGGTGTGQVSEAEEPKESDTNFLNPMVSGVKIYLSSVSGDDSRTFVQAQNPDTPWKSIEKVNASLSLLKGGDAVLFKRGETFHGHLVINQSGVSGTLPLLFATYGSGTRPKLTGMLRLTAGSLLNSAKGNQYQFAYQQIQRPNILLVDQQLYPLARFPRANAADAMNGYYEMKAFTVSSFEHPSLSGFTNLVGSEAIIKKNSWTVDRHPITGHSGPTLQFDASVSTTVLDHLGSFNLQNHPQFMTEFGDWSFNQTEKKLTVHLGAKNPSTSVVEYAGLANVITVQNASFIKFQNLLISGSNEHLVVLKNTNHINFTSNILRFSGGDLISGDQIPQLQLIGNTLTHAQTNGLFLTGGTKSLLVRKNTFRSIGMWRGMQLVGQSHMGFGIQNYWSALNASGALIEQNFFDQIGYVALSYNGNDNNIRRNVIRNFCKIKSDGGAIYSWNHNDWTTLYTKNLITENMIAATYPTPATLSLSRQDEVYGIYLDDGSNGVVVSNNTAYNNTAGIFLHNNVNIVVENNQLFNNKTQLSLVSDTLSVRMMDQIEIKDNFMLAGNAQQTMVEVRESKELPNSFVEFENNRYIDYFSNFAIFKTVSGSANIEKVYDLESFREVYSDRLSQSNLLTQFRTPPNLSYISTQNKVINSDFVSHIGSMYVWSAIGSSDGRWVASSPINNAGALEVTSPIKSMTAIILDSAMSASKYFHVKLSVSANKHTIFRVYLRMAGDPYQAISNSEDVVVAANQVKQAEFYLKTDSATPESILAIEDSSVGQLTYWLDNVEVREIKNPWGAQKQIYAVDNITAATVTHTFASTVPVLLLQKDSASMQNSAPISPYRSVFYLK